MLPKRLEKGDSIGVPAPSEPIREENLPEMEVAKKIFETDGFGVYYGKYIEKNDCGYGATAKHKAEDINEMFLNPNVDAIVCAKGGYNSNCTFDYLDYDAIQKNPKIFCGFSDITSLINVIYAKTGLVTFLGSNFKTVGTAESNYSYRALRQRLVEGSRSFVLDSEEWSVLQEGQAEGILVGGNLNCVARMVTGPYAIDFKDKILFLEDLGIETCPDFLSNFFYTLKQGKVFEEIKGIWLGNYEHESGITIEQVLWDTLEGEVPFPVIKSNHFGHVDHKIVIPIGVKAKMDTNAKEKIYLLEDCVK